MARRRPAAAAAVLLVAALAAGCDGEAVAEPRAPLTEQDLADVRAYAFMDQLEGARRYQDAAAVVAEVVRAEEPTTDWLTGLDLLRAEGSTSDEGGAVVEVRLRVPGEAATGEEHCYHYDLEPWGEADHAPSRVDCGDRPALAVPERVVPPRIADDADEVLRAALADTPAGGAPSAADVETAARRLVDERGCVSVRDDGGVIGVGVLVPPPLRDCVLARRTATGEVEVWHPGEEQVAPGEASCDAETAAAGGAQGSPH